MKSLDSQSQKTKSIELVIWLATPALYLVLNVFTTLFVSEFSFFELIYVIFMRNIGLLILSLLLGVFPFIFKSINNEYPLQYLKHLSDLNSNRKTKTETKVPFKEPQTYFDSLVNINIDHLNGYYQMVKEHTNKSFILSLILSISGFVLITFGIIFIILNSNKANINIIMTISGILIEFISGCAFYLYNKTVRQLKSYFDSLVHVQKILLSFKVVDDTKDNMSDSKNIMMHKALEFIWKDQPSTKTDISK